MNVSRVLVKLFERVWSIPYPKKYRVMKPISVVLLGSLLVSCTTLRPIDVDAVTLHQKIRSGDVVKVGDTIRAITIDGKAHLIYVTAVDNNVVIGHPPDTASDGADITLPIDDIVLVEISQFSAESGRTFASGAGTGAVIIGLAFLVGIIAF
jgi:translation initiation factor IF-1